MADGRLFIGDLAVRPGGSGDPAVDTEQPRLALESHRSSLQRVPCH